MHFCGTNQMLCRWMFLSSTLLFFLQQFLPDSFCDLLGHDMHSMSGQLCTQSILSMKFCCLATKWIHSLTKCIWRHERTQIIFCPYSIWNPPPQKNKKTGDASETNRSTSFTSSKVKNMMKPLLLLLLGSLYSDYYCNYSKNVSRIHGQI